MTPESVANNLAAVLNGHGHGFHHSVARRISELLCKEKSAWRVLAVEFPVTAGGRDYHIDIVLESRDATCYAVVECKRVNPARSLWAFLKSNAPYFRPGQLAEVTFEKLVRQSAGEKLRKSPFEAYPDTGVYSLGVSLRSGNKGDSEHGGVSSEAIQEAMTQSLRGTTGLANHFFSTRWEYLERTWRNPVLIPLVVTTASLWTADTNLADANLLTGDFDAAKLKPTEVDFLWCAHNQSRSIASPLELVEQKFGFSNWLKQNSTRAIGILNVNGLESFVLKDIPSWLHTFSRGA